MSHFTLLVIGNKGESLEELLRPWQESSKDRKYLVFKDIEDEERRRYETEELECFIDPEGKPHCMFDRRFRNPKYDFKGDQYLCPQGWLQGKRPFKSVYSNFETFMKEFCGSNERDLEKGRYGYWENPNAKWDWWALGGRWPGQLVLKQGAEGTRGEKDWTVEKEHEDQRRVDSCLAGDLDFEAMAKVREEECHRWYDEYEATAKAKPEEERWAAMEIAKRPDDTRESYVSRGRLFGTFAVLKDGQWYEKGKMGWWGAVHEEKNEEQWRLEFNALIKGLPADKQLSVVDCHI